jgi:hypothetical protein
MEDRNPQADAHGPGDNRIVLACSSCRVRLTMSKDVEGRKILCPCCERRFTVNGWLSRVRYAPQPAGDEQQPADPKPSPPLVQGLLRDIQDLTSRQFVYEDGWCGFVPADDALGEWQTGPPVPFADLDWREQADVLSGFINWDRYSGLGLAWNVEYTVSRNISDGKLPDRWLEGTSSVPQPEPAVQAPAAAAELAALFEEWRADYAAAPREDAHWHGREPGEQARVGAGEAPAATEAMPEARRVAGFRALVASDKGNGYLMEDADGEYRSWEELSAEGKVSQIAGNAAYYDVPFEPFAGAVRDALGSSPPAAVEEAALRLALRGERELHDLEKLFPDDGRTEPPPLVERVRELMSRPVEPAPEADRRLSDAAPELLKALGFTQAVGAEPRVNEPARDAAQEHGRGGGRSW